MEREVDDWKCLHVICSQCGHGNQLECPLCKMQENGLNVERIEKKIEEVKRIEQRIVEEEKKERKISVSPKPGKKFGKFEEMAKEKSEDYIECGKEKVIVESRYEKKSNTQQKIPRFDVPEKKNNTLGCSMNRMNSGEITDNTSRSDEQELQGISKKRKDSSKKEIFADIDKTSIEMAEPAMNVTCLSYFLKICSCFSKQS